MWNSMLCPSRAVKEYATYDKSQAETLSVEGINYEHGYTLEQDDTPTTMYFRGGNAFPPRARISRCSP